MGFAGRWHIFEMEGWDEDYFNMDVQAYIDIKRDDLGTFQFGLVQGEMDGKVVDHPDGKRFEFTWEGNDECTPVSGSGWVRLRGEDLLVGEFRIHLCDDSTFSAKRAE